MSRIRNFFRVLLSIGFSIISGAIIFLVAFWLSELAYDSNYLLLGFLLRVFLVVEVIGVALSVLWKLGVAVYTLFGPEMDW
ncbi:MAG: hypothetical protein IIC91_04645 [Chloroflexi bacterium]|nr:hypothetical protein [Chloroflexota bacterium]